MVEWKEQVVRDLTLVIANDQDLYEWVAERGGTRHELAQAMQEWYSDNVIEELDKLSPTSKLIVSEMIGNLGISVWEMVVDDILSE